MVEGLNDGRFAVYTKFHHSLIDGVSALKLMQRTLSIDPDDPEMRAMWSLPATQAQVESGSSPLSSLMRTAGSVAALGPSTVSLARAALLEQQLTLPFGAPRTMFNVKIGGARRCAAQSWSVDRIKSVKQAAGVTVNDVVLAMCSGALRYYLLEQNALPDTPLVAMVPVSLRSEDEADAGGNLVGAILCNLATDVDDPAQRLRDDQRLDAQQQEGVLRIAAAAGVGVVGAEYGPAEPGGGSGLRVVDAAAVQPRHLQCARTAPSRCTTAAPGSTATTRCRSCWTGRR